MPLTASTSSSLLLSSSSSSVADDDDDNNHDNESGIIIIDGGSIRSSSNNDGNDSDNAAAAAASPPPLSPLSQSSSQSCEMNGRDFGVIQRLPGNSVCIECGDFNYDDDDDNVVDVVVSPVSPVSASSASNNLDQPLWGSVSFGILFCQICSGKHRGLGTHISFVRSVTMDRWTLQQTEIMKCGGNAKCRDFILPRLRRMKRQQAQIQLQQNEEEPLPATEYCLEWDQLTLEEKYDNPIAEWYKRLLKEKADSGTLLATTKDITEMNAPDDMPPDLRRTYAAAIRQQQDREQSPTARSTVVLKDRIQGFGSSPVDSDDDDDDCWNPSRRWGMLMVAIPATLLIAGITWYLTNR